MGQFWDGWIASESNDHDAIKVKRVYIDLNDGNLFDGIIFSQIMYWHGRSKETGKPRLTIEREGFLWLAKTYEDWWEECRVNAATARKCIDRIVKRGLLVKRVWKFNGRPLVHLRVNIDIFEHQMNYVMHEKASIRPVVSNRIDTAGQIHLIPQVKSLTETTSETTPKTEKKEIPAPIVADAAETIEPTIVEANTPALPTTEGKILAFTPATETNEDTPPRRQRKPSKNAPMHDALIASFNLSGIKMNPKADKMYWAVAAELSDFPVDRVSELYSYVRRKSQVEKWNTFTVNALAKYAPDFLRDHPHKVTYIVDDSALPKAAGAEGDAIPITADKRAEAERLMAELLAKMNGNGVKRDSNRQ